MSFGITKTIPQSKGIAVVNASYDGSIDEFESRMVGKPSKLSVSDYVYAIFQDELVGRLKIKSLISVCYQSKFRETAHFNFRL